MENSSTLFDDSDLAVAPLSEFSNTKCALDLTCAEMLSSEPRSRSLKRSFHSCSQLIDTKFNFSQEITPLFSKSLKNFNIQSTPRQKVHFNENNKCLYITPEQLANEFYNYFLIDCRWPYEYEAGTIKGAMNLYDGQVAMNQLINIQQPITQVPLVFFCEYSMVRSVKMYNHIKQIDNVVHGKFQFYNEMFILEGGFNRFYQQFKEFTNGYYVQEKDPEYEQMQIKYSANGTYQMNIYKIDLTL